MGNTSGRAKWKATLEKTTVEDLLKARHKAPAKMVKIPAASDIQTALKILGDHNILSAPVVVGGPPIYSEAHAHDDGFIDALDIITFITHDTIATGSWSVSPAVFSQNVMQMTNKSGGNKMLLFTKKDALASVASAMASNKLYRVAVVDDEKRLVVDILTQSDVINFVAEHANDPWFSDRADSTLDQLGFARKPKMFTCTDVDRTMSVLALLPAYGISALAVVDADGKYVGQLNASLLRGMGPDDTKDLALPVGEFLKKRSKDKAEVSTCPGSITFRQAVERLKKDHLHRLFVLDAAGKPTGVISLTDVLHELIDPHTLITNPGDLIARNVGLV